MRGFYGIGVYHPKSSVNIGTLWRSATLYQADFIFTIGPRYVKQASDTLHTTKHIPLYTYASFEDFYDHLPYDSQLVCVELMEFAVPLARLIHPERSVYVLGAEDHGLPDSILKRSRVNVKIECPSSQSMNVATAGTLVMYDRYLKTFT